MRNRNLPEGTAHTLSFVIDRVSPGRLIDVGGGDGLLGAELVELGFEVCVVEPDGDRAEAARSRGLDVVQDDARALEKLTADTVLFSRSLHHVSDPAAALRLARSAVVPGGTVLVEDFGRDLVTPGALEWRYARRLASQGLEEKPNLESLWVAEHPPRHVQSSRTLEESVDDTLPGAWHSQVAYLYRYLLDDEGSVDPLRPGAELRRDEEGQIHAGRFPAIGLRWSWRRPPVDPGAS